MIFINIAIKKKLGFNPTTIIQKLKKKYINIILKFVSAFEHTSLEKLC